MKVEEIEAGPELDQLVATVVMGVQHHFEDQTHWITVNGKLLSNWHPSTDIRDAWEVFEKLFDDENNVWIIGKYGTIGYECRHTTDCFEPARGATPSLAICRAALKYFSK